MTKKNTGAKGSTGLTNKQGKDKASKQAIVASQFSTETASTAKVKGMAVGNSLQPAKSPHGSNAVNPDNPNSRRKKKVGSGGRTKEQKNYVKVRDDKGNITGYINEHGVEFTTKELKALRSGVDTLIKKQKRMKDSELGLLVGYDMNGKLINDRDRLMTFEGQKGLHQFTNRQQYDRYMEELKTLTNRNYMSDLVNDYKGRYLKTIRSTTDMSDKEYQKIVKHINKMSQKEFAMRFGMDLFGTITLYYDNFDTTDRTANKHQAIKNNKQAEFQNKYKSEKRAQREYNKWLRKFERDLDLHHARLDAAGGGSAVNIEDIYRRLGIGEDSVQVDTKNNRYTQHREQQRAKRQREQERRDEQAQEYEDKYQQFLNDWGLEDTEKTREKFRTYQPASKFMK